MMRRAIVAGAIAHVASAYWVDPAPQATNAIEMKELGDAIGWSPVPTQSPTHRDLLRRQAATQILGYLAPDNTCGYVAGRLGGVKTCDTDANCAAVLGTDDFYTMGCCGGGLCTMQGACYDYASMSSCDQACLQDINIVKCSQTSYPFCYPYSVPGMNMGFYSCDSVTTSVFQEFETTFSGQTDAGTWLALRSSDFDSLLESSTASATRATGTGVRTLTNSIASGTQSGASSSTQSPFTTTPIPNPDNGGKKTNIGAIVGGVVGGLAALGLIAGAIIFLFFKKRKNKNAANTQPPVAPAMQYQNAPPPNGPQGGTGYFAPVAAGGKFDGTHTVEPKYDQQPIPGSAPLSPAPAYSSPISPAGSPPPPMDPRYSYAPPPPQGYSEAPANAYAPPPQQTNYPPPQQTHYPPPGAPANAPTPQPAAPVELGNTYAVPSQHQGRPVYEAA